MLLKDAKFKKNLIGAFKILTFNMCLSFWALMYMEHMVLLFFKAKYVVLYFLLLTIEMSLNNCMSYVYVYLHVFMFDLLINLICCFL